MIQIREYLTTKIIQPSKIKATNDTIYKIIKNEMDKYGHDCNLNHVDVSEVTSMCFLFNCSDLYLGKRYNDLNPDISEWNVSNVKNMFYMFCHSIAFNQDLSRWDVSNVKDMSYMFYECKRFNNDISKWNVSNVENMSHMFYQCESFNQNLSKWNVSNVELKSKMFDECPIREEFKPNFE